MDKIPWEGRVAELDADASGNVIGLYLNADSDTGIKEGDEMEILTAGRAIIDPDTKTVIGRTKDTRIGRCKVETLQKSLSSRTDRRQDGQDRRYRPLPRHGAQDLRAGSDRSVFANSGN